MSVLFFLLQSTPTEFLSGALRIGRAAFRRTCTSKDLLLRQMGIKQSAAAGTTDSRRNLSAESQGLLVLRNTAAWNCLRRDTESKLAHRLRPARELPRRDW